MSIAETLKGKTLLITGGTGSFGRTLARTLLSDCPIEKVIIFSRDEWKQWEMQQSDPLFSSSKIRYFLGDVRDLQRLTRAFNDVDYIIHTAALKQVPAAEYNPSEFVKTNVLGAMNIIEASINCGVKKVIALSTDKACNPVNLYGATKLCSDKLFVNGNAYVGARGYPTFSVVRYGNVLGSRGSIIPHWKKQIAEGAATLSITDAAMTRFWISLKQAVDFVLSSLMTSKGGEIFVPKIPSMKITDLAAAIAPELPIEICGIRPGEKLHEMMITVEDASHTVEFEDHYAIIPKIHAHSSEEMIAYSEGGNKVPADFSYRSDTNSQWLDVATLQALLTNEDTGN